MNDSVFTFLIKQFRVETGLSQKQIAEMLGVKQATVSRIEAGKTLPSKSLAEKIKQLQVKEGRAESGGVSKSINLEPMIRSINHTNVSTSYLLIPFGERSGDYSSFDKLVGNKHSFILADSVGHGNRANRMSFAIEFGYQTILSTFNSKIINAALIELGLREAILRTDKEWLGPPGIISGIIDTLSGDFELINSGQPVPIIFSGGVTSELSTRKQDDPSINRGNTVESVSKNLSSLKPGDALALVSDGFLELFSQVSGQHFVERFNKAAKAFKGDSRAILTNILSAINKELVINSGLVKDDATIMLISRVREK